MKKVFLYSGVFIISYILFLFISYKTAMFIPIHSYNDSVIISGLCIIFATIVLFSILLIVKH
ncbi:hypothetical protein [Oceanirhabdus sp. W0125-5]|uniref:hypothetical protein n=1 Tax=Oceanirhabdus sp. W0125-5 TaxID=2999116 RepID=UPI0022F2FF79|nr:hypothetical protein [Oceanirhabdus sp. W0125-5]WBW99661.1 hypothetical protein OW730_13200 [Oceanirhabdus sp. W0125-5]